MSGGVSAKKGFRFQDWCAVYVLLDYYQSNSTSLEFLNFERGVIDFEVWLNRLVENYQIKGGETSLSAAYLNSIFKHLSAVCGKDEKKRDFTLVLFFSSQPKHSLLYLIEHLGGNRGVKDYNRKTTRYISSALTGIDPGKITIRHRSFSEQEIRCLCFGLAKNILERHYSKTKELLPAVIDNFLARLREEIDAVSTIAISERRKISRKDLLDLIDKTISIIRHIQKTPTRTLNIKLKIDEHVKRRLLTSGEITIPPGKVGTLYGGEDE